ncbi:hypothetical protein ACF0H5_015681 [Mactra antiquata]
MPNIKTFCRIKPTTESYDDFEASSKTIFLRVPEVLKDFNANNKGSRPFISHEFNFNHIFMQDATQENVFNVAALDIVNGFLNGYNGTIFAYGQTGTGKTYTVEGSAKTYHSRGLEPRSLSMIYKELEKRTTEDLSIHISYLEIYQDVGYDLLNPGARTQSYVTPFPKVNVIEGASGSCVVRNLSSHMAASEDVAQSLLLQGQANRKVAATAIHDRSSRSHAVFTIQLTTKKIDSDTIVRSKLHLVDLAGSERVAKTRVLGHQLTEAKSINLSLHHLETVIVALQEEALSKEKGNRARTSYGSRRNNSSVVRPSSADGIRGPRHVPYRNSLLTMLLRDSLGGNCMTAMIATISLEISNLGESISTCRFAGRVSCIANSVSRNEELDEKSIIRKLKKRIAELETELACLKLSPSGEEVDSRMKLSDEDKQICSQVVKQYLAGRIADPITAGITNPNKFRECLRILKKVVGHQSQVAMDTNNNSLTVTLPSHQAIENGTSGNDGEPDIGQTLPRHNVQKLKEEEHNRVNSSSQRPIPKPRRSQPVRRTNSFEMPRPSGQADDGVVVTRDQVPSGVRRQATEAWISNSNTTNESRVTTATTGERLWTSNSKKDPETISMLLQESGKTPFEQKRVNEIKKLSSKVEKIATEKSEQEKKVLEMKILIAEKELDLMEKHMKTKLTVTTAQVNDQRAYVKQLISTDADSELLHNEKLVEKQLRRRQEKYERQLAYIEYKRENLKRHMDGEEDTAEKMSSLQDKYGQFKKRDGSLNTRQVFQMLKAEERKHTKAKTQVDREKIMATAELMELKELATRQKLRELKEAMASGQSLKDTSLTNGHNDRNNRNKSPVPVNDDPTDEWTKQSTSVPNNDFYTKRKSEKDPTAKWESNYSRPTTPSNLTFKTADVKPSQSQNEPKVQNQPKVTFDKNTPAEKSERNESSSDVKHTRKPLLSEEDMLEIKSRSLEKELNHSRTNRRSREKSVMEPDSRTYMPSEYVNGISNNEKFDARKMNLSSKNFDSALNSMLGQENGKLYPDSNDYDEFARTSKYRPNPYLEAQKTTQYQSRVRRSQTQRSGRENTRDSRSADTVKQSTDISETSMSKPSRNVSQSSERRRNKKDRPRPSSAEGIDMSRFLINTSFNSTQNASVQFEQDEQPGRVTALDENEREKTYMSKAQIERDRVNRIRKARQSAEIIQRSWRRYLAQKKYYMKKRK